MKKQSNTRLFRVYLGTIVIFATSIGSVLAAGINIGDPTKGTEFGQGIYLIKACDDWVKLNLAAGATGANGAPAGYSALTGITIDGLDTAKCKSTKFTIGARNSFGAVLPLYRIDKNKVLCADKACVIGKSAEGDFDLSISALQIAALTISDSYHTLSFNSSTGIYTVTFTQPTILATDVSSIFIQSSSI
jgi:hypothetical protein